MIGPHREWVRFSQSLIGLAALCAPVAEAQEQARPGALPPFQARPASELLGRSLGLTAALLAVGAVALVASRKLATKALSDKAFAQHLGTLQRPTVTGRVRLTPRQTVHVLAIGPRVLVLGTGPQGAPELLTEWIAAEESQVATEEELNEHLQPIPLTAPAHAVESAA